MAGFCSGVVDRASSGVGISLGWGWSIARDPRLCLPLDNTGDSFSPLSMQLPSCLLQEKQIDVLAVRLFSTSMFQCFFSKAQTFRVYSVSLGTVTAGFNLTDISVVLAAP